MSDDVEVYLSQEEMEILAKALRAATTATHVTIPHTEHEALRAALDNSQSLLVAMLHEQRPEKEIEDQIVENRAALRAAGIQIEGE